MKNSAPRIARRADSGWSLVEVTVGLTLISIIVLGVTASLSTAAVGAETTNDELESALLLDRVLQEVQASPYDTLLTFNGTFLVEGDHRADIRVALVATNLIQIQVDVVSQVDPNVATRGVLLVADTE